MKKLFFLSLILLPLSVFAGTVRNYPEGATELKDASSANYADINDANTARTTTTHVLATQPIDAEGHVVDWSDLDDSKTALQVIDNVVGVPDSTIGTNVTQVGFKAVDPSSLPTDVTAGDSVYGIADLKGRQIVYLGTALDSSNDSVSAVSKASASIPGFDTSFDSDCDNTAQALKASAGNLYKLDVYNSNAAVAFVQVYDVASGSVTVGVTTPKYVFYVPSQGAVTSDINVPMTFSTAMTYACTTTSTGAGDPAVGLTYSAGYK